MKRMQRNIAASLLAGALLPGLVALSPVASAVTANGTLGATSTGSMDVSIRVADLVLIRNLNPLSLPYVPGSNATGVETFCVWSSSAGYSILIDSQRTTGATGTFLAAGTLFPTNTVNYTLMFDDDTTPADGISVTNETRFPIAAPFHAAAAGVVPGCAADNASVQVTSTEAGNLNTAVPDAYVDELTLIVEPE